MKKIIRNKNRVSLILILLFFSCHSVISAQDIIVKSLLLNLRDISASTAPRMDENGIPCALLKVATINDRVQFSGNVIGNVENKINEYWVYMKSGTEEVTVSTPSCSQVTISFADYDINSLQSKLTYNMILIIQEPNNYVDSQMSYSECLIAAQSGSPSALVNLGKCCLYGIGTYENPSEAARYFEMAAKAGNVEAIHLIGNSYFYGIGNPKNYKIAVEYYIEAANKKYAPSLYYLGVCYEQGKGVKQNEKKAQKYYMEAANEGYSKAQSKLKR